MFQKLRVIELAGQSAAAWCGKLFAGLGAEVLRADREGIEPELDSQGVWLDTGKSKTRLDWNSESGRSAAISLIRGADVLIDGYGPEVLDGFGFTPERLRALNPNLVLVRITPFGGDGPYRSYQAEEITLYAMSGLMHSTGDRKREPLASGPGVCHFTAGLKAYLAAAMALLRRARSGHGDVVDLSLHEVNIENAEIALAEFFAVGKVAVRNNDEHPMVPWRTYPCRDGHVAIIGAPIRNWRRGALLFEAPELLGPEFANMLLRIQHRDRLRALITPWLMRNDRRTIYQLGQEAGLAWGYVATLPEALDSPQSAARNYFVDIDQPGYGRCRMPDAPFRSERLPWHTRTAPTAPIPAGQLSALWPERSVTADAGGEAPPQPLSGLKVIDFTHDWAGPHAGRLFADYGAEVIKIEYPKLLDGMRGGYRDHVNEHSRFWQLNRGKRSVALDLNIPEHLECCKRLIAEADVVIENSRAGVMKKLGLGYEVLSALNPRLVMASLSAFGACGPESAYAGYGGTIEALSGLQSLTAYDADGVPMRIREMDVFNGIMGACAVMSGLLQRETSGVGCWIDVAESEACGWLLGEFFIELSHTGRAPQPRGNRHPRFVQGCYRCAGDDRWIVLTVRDDAEWSRLVATIGVPELARDARFADAAARRSHHDDIDTLIAEWTGPREAYEVMETLQAQKLACGMVCNVRDLAQDPHLTARGWFIEAPDGRFPGFPFRFAAGGARYRGRGPKLGADNEAALSPLGLSRSAWPDLSPDQLRTAFDE
jgi:crotonobetainyl-CoA:carnitine CoA-transferase CaiB-like acyl-CoA transferase